MKSMSGGCGDLPTISHGGTARPRGLGYCRLLTDRLSSMLISSLRIELAHNIFRISIIYLRGTCCVAQVFIFWDRGK
jgi:hypothetical protein